MALMTWWPSEGSSRQTFAQEEKSVALFLETLKSHNTLGIKHNLQYIPDVYSFLTATDKKHSFKRTSASFFTLVY